MSTEKNELELREHDSAKDQPQSNDAEPTTSVTDPDGKATATEPTTNGDDVDQAKKIDDAEPAVEPTTTEPIDVTDEFENSKEFGFTVIKIGDEYHLTFVADHNGQVLVAKPPYAPKTKDGIQDFVNDVFGTQRTFGVNNPTPMALEDVQKSSGLESEEIKQAINNISAACNLTRDVVPARICEFAGYDIKSTSTLLKYASTQQSSLKYSFLNQVKMMYAEVQEDCRILRGMIKRANQAIKPLADLVRAASTAPDKSDSASAD